MYVAGIITHVDKRITRGPNKGASRKIKLKTPLVDLRLTLEYSGSMPMRTGDFYKDQFNYEYRCLGANRLELQNPVGPGYLIPNHLIFAYEVAGNFTSVNQKAL